MQYDESSSPNDVNQALSDNDGLSDATRLQIEQILGIAPGGGATSVNVGTFDGSTLTAPAGTTNLLIVTPPTPDNPNDVVEIDIPDEVLGSAQAYLFETDANIAATFNTVERVIASGNGNDLITVNGDKNTTLDGSDGHDTLVTSGGNDSVTGGEGNDSISTGAGNDTIVAGEGNDTVDGGTGLDIVQMSSGGTTDDYGFAVVNGQLLVVADNGDDPVSVSVLAKNVEIISFGESENVIISGNQDTATALRMYEGLLDRNADLAGAQAWINGMNDTLTVQQATQGFLDSAEFKGRGITTNEQFVDSLYSQALYREAEAEGRAAWLDGLENGLSWVDVAIGIVGSGEANEVNLSSFLIPGQV